MPDKLSPPLPKSNWFPAALETSTEDPREEPPAAPPPAAPAPAGLGWKPPSCMRVRVPVFERDGAPENTTPPAAPRVPAALVDACIGADPSLELIGVRFEGNALIATMRTSNDETVRQLREHIVPPQSAESDDAATDELEMSLLRAHLHRPASVVDGNGRAVCPAPMPPDEALVVDAVFDPDFREVASGPTAADCAARFQGGVNFAPPDEIPPPKGAQAAQAPADPCGRDDATPNDGVVPQGQDEGFRCALWSNDMLEMRTSDGEHILLNSDDTRALLRYVGDKLSARARAAA